MVRTYHQKAFGVVDHDSVFEPDDEIDARNFEESRAQMIPLELRGKVLKWKRWFCVMGSVAFTVVGYAVIISFLYTQNLKHQPTILPPPVVAVPLLCPPIPLPCSCAPPVEIGVPGIHIIAVPYVAMAPVPKQFATSPR